RSFTAGGRAGAYFRVLTKGRTSPGDAIEVLHRPSHGVTIGDAFRGLDPDRARALLDWAAGTETVLYDSLARAALIALERAGHGAECPVRLRSTGRAIGLGMGLWPEDCRSTSTCRSARYAADTATSTPIPPPSSEGADRSASTRPTRCGRWIWSRLPMRRPVTPTTASTPCSSVAAPPPCSRPTTWSRCSITCAG